MLTPTISSSILDGNIDRSTASVMGIDDSGMARWRVINNETGLVIQPG